MNLPNISFQSNSNDFWYNSGTDSYRNNLEPHTHTNYEIYYFLDGEITYFVEGNHYTAMPHDIFITNHKELHSPLVNLDKSYTRRFIQFESDFVMPLSELDCHLLAPLDNRPLGHLNKIDHSYVKDYGIDQLFDRLEALSISPDKYTDFESRLVLNHILLQIKRIFDSHIDDFSYHHTDEKIYSIIKHINENISHNLLVEDIAEHFFMNKYYLSHFFKKNTGFSIKEYITSKRIMLAKNLISKGIPITSACYDVGFNDYSSFYKAFIKLEHKSPKTFLTENLHKVES